MIPAFRAHTIQRFHGALQGCEDINPALLRRLNSKCSKCLAYGHTGSQQQSEQGSGLLIPSLLL